MKHEHQWKWDGLLVKGRKQNKGKTLKRYICTHYPPLCTAVKYEVVGEF